MIGLKDSRQFFSQWEAKLKPIAPCTRDFSRASSELQVISRNCDWFIALFAPVVIGRSYCFGFGFSTVIWKPLYSIWLGKWSSLPVYIYASNIYLGNIESFICHVSPQQQEVLEFPNPLLEIPLKEENGEIVIPGNRALINLNLSSKSLLTCYLSPFLSVKFVRSCASVWF